MLLTHVDVFEEVVHSFVSENFYIEGIDGRINGTGSAKAAKMGAFSELVFGTGCKYRASNQAQQGKVGQEFFHVLDVVGYSVFSLELRR